MAAVSVMPANRPNTATPRAKRNACRTRSRSSCTSTINNSSRFSPMINSRRAKRFDVSTRFPTPMAAGSITLSIAVAGTPAGDEITGDGADTEGNRQGLIRMFTHGFIGGFGTFDRLVLDPAQDLLAAFQRGGKTFAGFADFFSGHIRRGRHQGACIFGERAHVTAGCLCLFVHMVLFFLLVGVFQW